MPKIASILSSALGRYLFFFLFFLLSTAGLRAATVANAQFVGADNGDGTFTYTVTLNNTGTTVIKTFWFSWIPGEDFMSVSPTGIVSPTNWTSAITHAGTGDGFAIQWTTTSTGLATSGSLNFVFTSTTTPAQMSGNSTFYTDTPVGTSFVYSGAPLTGTSDEIVVAQAPPFTTTTDGTGGLIISGYTGAGGAVTIPSTISGLTVTQIGNSAFYENTTITTVSIPSTVTVIGYYAFEGCTALTTVNIPSGVTSILQDCFDGCTSLANVSIPNGVTFIGDGAFEQAVFTSMTIPSSVTSIGGDAFANCTNLTTLNIPNSVTSIGLGAFGNCFALTTVTMGTGVTQLQDSTFEQDTALTNVTIGPNVAQMGTEVFLFCSSLTSVTIPASMTEIGRSSFASCPALANVTFNGNAPQVGTSLFLNDASNLKVHYHTGATGFTTPTWTDSSGDTYPATPDASGGGGGTTPATVTLGGLAATYNGSPHPVTVTTKPAGLSTSVTYNSSATVPTNAGSYAVVATITDASHTGSAMGTLVIKPAAAKVTVAKTTVPFDGSSKSASATTVPAGLPLTFTYNGSSTAPTAVGTYAVVATVNSPNATGTGKGTLTISKGTATVTLANLAATYDGNPHAATATTTPSGKTVTFTYGGKTMVPVNAGSYAVVGTISDPDYQGSASGTLVISKATVGITLGGLAATFTGKAIAATAVTNPVGQTVTFAYASGGKKVSPVNVGSYDVTATVSTANGAGMANGTLVISAAAATVNFTKLSFIKTGKPIPATAATVPAKLALAFTYGGSSTPPTNVGDYAVVAMIANPNYTGSASATMVIAQTLPTATTSAATALAAQTATLNGSVNPNGAAASVYFQYGPTTSYGHTTTPQSIPSGTTVVKFSANPSGLTPVTTYHFRAVAVLASDASAVVFGSDLSFKTLAMPTFPGGAPAPLLSAAGAQVTVAINPAGVSTTVFFKYGTASNNLNLSTGTISIGAGTTTLNIGGLLSGLQPSTQYFYELVTQSAAGTFNSTVQSFTTLGYDTTVVAQPGDAAADVANGTFASFHNPAVNEHDAVAFAATLNTATGITAANNLGIWADDNSGTRHLIARIGVAGGAPLATGTGQFSALGDPVFNNTAQLAFSGTLTVAAPVTKTTDLGVWTTSSGSLALLAQEGGAAPGTSGATFATFFSIGLPDSGGAIILATLAKATGITTANNAGIWQGTSTSDLHLVLRLGQTVGAKTIAALSPLTSETELEGQTRNFNSTSGDFVCGATFTDGTHGVVKVVSGTASLVVQDNDVAPDTSGATFTDCGFSIVNTHDRTAFLGAVSTGNNGFGIWADDNTNTRHLVARAGQVAPGTPSLFSVLSSPLYNNNGAVVFDATYVTGSGKTAQTLLGMWSNVSGSLAKVAVEGDQAPGCPPGAVFSTFTGVALPDVGGAVFLGSLTPSSLANVTTSNNTGIWAVDQNNTLQLIVRTGDVINGKTITALSFLPATSLLDDQTRNFSQTTGDLVYLATFSDKSTAIFNVVFP